MNHSLETQDEGNTQTPFLSKHSYGDEATEETVTENIRYSAEDFISII